MRITAANGAIRNLQAACVAPRDWPEQRVRLIEAFNPSAVLVRDHAITGMARQMTVAVPLLGAGQTLEVIHTYEITRIPVDLPAEPEKLVIPKKLSKELRAFLHPSPGIESNHRDLRDLQRQLSEQNLPDWQQVQRYYDWTRANISYVNGTLNKGARKALRDRNGDCEEFTAVFIALCRNAAIPARTVWASGHAWAEFYLEDAASNGQWFPAELTGAREFGFSTSTLPILQKGDHFKPAAGAGRRAFTSRYVAPWALGFGGTPQAEFIEEVVPSD